MTDDPRSAYLSTLADEWLARRGAPLVISPSEYAMMVTWFEAGVPFRVVLRALDDAGPARRHLRYYAEPVERAFRLWQKAMA